MKKRNIVKFIKLILLVLVTITLVGLTIYLFPLMKNLSTYEGQVVFKENIQKIKLLILIFQK